MTLFAYTPGQTLCHTLDVRCKCALVCLVSLTLLKAHLWGNLACLPVLICLLDRLNLGPARLAGQLKWFLLFLALIILSRALTLPGDPIFSMFNITGTVQGLISGTLMALRFLSIMLMGLVLAATTRAMEIKAAAQWFLKPVPLVPEKRVAVMIGLSLRFIPLILNQAAQVSQAVNARCGHLRKNPARRIFLLSWPLLKKTFQSAENISLAMDARCYADDRTDPQFCPNGKEGLVLGAALVFCAGILLLKDFPGC